MLVLAALGIDSRYCKTLELVTTELVRLPYDAEVCRSKGYFYKATPIYKVSSNFSQVKANFAFAACSVNSDRMNAENHVFYRQ